MARQPSMKVENALRRELASLRGVDRAASESAIAADALALARRIDDPETSASAVASCSRALAKVLSELRLLGMPQAPPAETGDRVDELASRRKARVAKAAKRPARKRAAR